MAGRDNRRIANPSTDYLDKLRAVFVKDWGLKLLALAITLVLWFIVSGRTAEREIPVEVKPEGKPAAAFVIKEIVVSPPKIKVQGPISKLNEMEKLILPVSVEGRRESFDLPIKSLPLDQKVQPLGIVNVHVSIAASDNSSEKPAKPN